MIVTLTANPSLDRVYRLRELRRGGVHRAMSCWTEPSGKGVNVSRALAANGTATIAVAPVGGPVGDELEHRLRQESFAFVAVPIENGIRSNVTLLEPDGSTTKINEGGPRLTRRDAERLISTAAAQAESASWVVGSGSLPAGVDDDFYGRLRRSLAGLDLAVDASGEALRSAITAGVDLIKPNRAELEQSSGTPIRTFADVVDRAQDVRARGVRTVLVSLGADGAVLVTEDGAVHGQVRLDRVTSTAGAGDALLAGFLASGDGGIDALAQGLRWAATRCLDDGPTMAPSADFPVELSGRIPYDRSLTVDAD